MKNNNKQLWINKNYLLNIASIFNKDLLVKYINQFWNDIVDNINNDQHILLLVRMEFNKDEFVTIGNLQKLNKNDKDYLVNYLLNIIELKSDTYVTIPIKSITFSYGIREGYIENKIINNLENKFQLYHNNKLPISFNPKDYGKVLQQFDNKWIISTNNKAIIIITQIINEEKYNLVEYYKNNTLTYSWKDIYINENTFERHLGKNIYTYENNELVLLKVIKPSKIINKIKTSRNLNNKIITMDLETYKGDDNKLYPYLLCWYDGIIKKSYFINDFNNSFQLLLNKVMNDLCIRKYNNYKIYLHNFSKFDGIFLLKHLANIKDSICDPIIHNGKIFTIQFNFNNNSLHFRDSYLLLPSSLKQLCISFNNNINKDIFPVLFNDINYIGEVPDIKYFNNITLDEYLNYKEYYLNKVWNFINESIKYCFIDCISLYEILIKFNQLIFDKFNLNINNCITLPSLSFNIYRSKYLPDNTITGLTGKTYNDIKQSYTGGSVDMYIPFNNIDENELIYCYDVNSLYPFNMIDKAIPIGKATHFQGNILKFNKNAFGFFYCEVETPKYLDHPIIQIHHNTKEGIRTISPLGNFEMMIFSEEMYNAEKLGYKFNIKWGYTFEKGYIFTEFINDLYNIRLNYPKSDPMNFISKILMNSLYGRFGMNDNFDNIIILDKNNYQKFENKYINFISDMIDLDNKYLINIKKDLTNTLLDNGSENHNINIAIASAITAYSRIHMSQFKNNSNYKLFYSDTDSIYINKELDSKLVSNTELGKLKLEYICNKAIFLAPKVYALNTNENKEIIKVKGLTKEGINTISINDLEELLIKDSNLEIKLDKWYKSLEDSTITIKEQLYNLKVTNNKRDLIYNKDNKLINTKPINIKEL